MTAETPAATVFIDSNVWLYAFIDGQDRRKTAVARQVIQTPATIFVSTQVINEVAVQLIKRESFTEAQTRAVVSDFYRRFTVIELNLTILLKASELREQYQLSFWDGFIVACALTGGATTLYSEDMHHRLHVQGQLTIVNPFTTA